MSGLVNEMLSVSMGCMWSKFYDITSAIINLKFSVLQSSMFIHNFNIGQYLSSTWPLHVYVIFLVVPQDKFRMVFQCSPAVSNGSSQRYMTGLILLVSLSVAMVK